MITLHQGDCLEVLPGIESGSIDAVICDPPYPEISRDYGRMTEADWHAMMRGVVAEVRRVLTPKGSAVFVLQPNSERVGRMRPWLWEFMAWTCREWNMVQDVWWWNSTSPPTVHCHRTRGLMRPSLKACVWLGDEDCYRNQGEVLWRESHANAAKRASDRFTNDLETRPSSQTMRVKRCVQAAEDRGGVTPFNVLLVPAADSVNSGGAEGHGAGTPPALSDWWVRYITKPGDTVLDPFAGSGTIPLAAYKRDRNAIGIEKMDKHFATCERRCDAVMNATPLFAEA